MIRTFSEVKHSMNNKRKSNYSSPDGKKKFRNSSHDKSDINKFPKNDLVQQKVAYFENILQTLKSGLSEDSKSLFIINALDECKDNEVELSCHSSSSHCIELLLSLCKNFDLWTQFMSAFSKQKEIVCSNPNASHITELLLHYSLQNIKNWSTIIESEDDDEKEKLNFFISWVTEFGDFLSENFISFLEAPFSSHVACSIIKALGGEMTQDLQLRSKKSINHKKEFSSEFSDKEEMLLPPVTLEDIPKCYKKTLKHLSRTVRKIEYLSNYVTENYTVTVFQVLVLVLGKRLPKQSGKLVADITNQLFSEKNDEGVPFALLDQSCSFLVEKFLQVADEKFQNLLWEQYVFPNCEFLVEHKIGNFIIQRLFDTVKESSLLLTMCEKVGESFSAILQVKNYGIFISIASACIRLKAHQAFFMKTLMEHLQCIEFEERQLQIIPLLLNFKKFEEYEPPLNVCYHGSLIVQKLLTFQKPIKLVKSLMSLKSEELSYLACHIQGCHVLTAFFRSTSVGEKNKDKFLQCFLPILVKLACDYNGSLTLSRMWTLLSIKQKERVAENLSQNREKLKGNKNGYVILNKFNVYCFKLKYEEWKETQLKLVQKPSK